MAKAKTIVAAKSPLTACPFTGNLLTVVKLSNGDFQLRGHGWVCTKMFQLESQAWHWASHRNGVAPAFDAVPKIEVSEVREPEPDPTDGVIPDILKKM